MRDGTDEAKTASIVISLYGDAKENIMQGPWMGGLLPELGTGSLGYLNGSWKNTLRNLNKSR